MKRRPNKRRRLKRWKAYYLSRGVKNWRTGWIAYEIAMAYKNTLPFLNVMPTHRIPA